MALNARDTPNGFDNVDGPVGPVFLQKRNYRRRRVMDGLRLLPVFGLWLFMVPILWPSSSEVEDAGSVPMSGSLIYVFVIWILLIVLSAVLAGLQTHLAKSDESAESKE